MAIIYSIWGHIIGSDSNDILRRGVLRLVKCQTRLSRKHADESLFGDERPRELIGAIRVEVDFDPPGLFDGHEPLWVEFTLADLRGAGEPGGGTE